MTERVMCSANCNSMVSLRPEVSSDSVYDVFDTPCGVSFFAYFRFFSFIYYYFYYAYGFIKKCSTVKAYELHKRIASPVAV